MNKKMKMTHAELLQKLVSTGMKKRYGDNLKSVKIKPSVTLCSMIPVKMLWEMKQIINAGFVDYYIMAFWIFRKYAMSAEINVWARGAMPSSIVCYCLGLTVVDPMKYGLHSVLFVNDKLPNFLFDIEASRFNEFKKGAEELLQANARDYDIAAIKACLLREDVKLGKGVRITYLTPGEYLSRKHERPLPENLDDDLARYSLKFPKTKNLYEAYIQQPSTFNGLIYQEQMLDILKETFHAGSIKANQIRIAIQRGEKEQVETYKKEVFADLNDITIEEAETAWQRLTSNPRAFLKAHAVSRVIEKYKFEIK